MKLIFGWLLGTLYTLGQWTFYPLIVTNIFRDPSLPLSASDGPRCSLACGIITPISLPFWHTLSSVSSPLVSTPTIGFSAHLESSRKSSWDLQFTASTKTLFPNKCPFLMFWVDMNFEGTLLNSLYYLIRGLLWQLTWNGTPTICPSTPLYYFLQHLPSLHSQYSYLLLSPFPWFWSSGRKNLICLAYRCIPSTQSKCLHKVGMQ